MARPSILNYNTISSINDMCAKAIDLIYVASTNQLVDLLTKLLIVDETQHFHKFMGLASQSCVPLNVNK
jgi:hypothetical protein